MTYPRGRGPLVPRCSPTAAFDCVRGTTDSIERRTASEPSSGTPQGAAPPPYGRTPHFHPAGSQKHSRAPARIFDEAQDLGPPLLSADNPVVRRIHDNSSSDRRRGPAGCWPAPSGAPARAGAERPGGGRTSSSFADDTPARRRGVTQRDHYRWRAWWARVTHGHLNRISSSFRGDGKTAHADVALHSLARPASSPPVRP